MKHFKAPWGRTLLITSTIAVLVCLAVTFCPHTSATPANPRFFLLRAVPLILVFSSALFIIRGYIVTPDAILIQRLFWNTRLSLADLQTAIALPDAMRGSIRTCGNGGLFSFTGWYFSKPLGSYRAFVTDAHLTVVLRFQKRTAVLSPENPERFADEVMARKSQLTGKL